MSRSLDELQTWMSASARAGSLPFRPGVRVLAGGKGGVGTSTLSALAAVACARAGVRTLLVEVDPSGLPLLLGLPGERMGAADLRGSGVEVEDLLVSPSPCLDLLPAGSGEGGSWSDPGARDLLLRRVGELYERYERVVVDGGNRAASVIPACELGVEHVWIVTGPDRLAAAGTYALLKLLRRRYPEVPASLLANPGTSRTGDVAAELVREAARSFLGWEIQVALRVPPDPDLADRAATGTSLAAGEGLAALDAIASIAVPASASHSYGAPSPR